MMDDHGFKYLVLSDVHLGHPRTKTDFILDNLKTYLTDELLEKLDMVFIAGDFFDRLIDLSNHDVLSIGRFIRWFYNKLSKFYVSLRVLKGTNSHDRDQCLLFETILDACTPTVELNFRYIDKLHIESYLDKINILYIPDEWRPTSEEVFKDVKTLLSIKELNKVDIVIMHGMFSFQVPKIVKSPLMHKEQNYLDICKHYIHVGHIHISSIFERIIGQASFDRLAHGEEGHKGGWYVEIYKDQTKDNIKFIENKNAKKYITINVKNKTIDEINNRINTIINKLPPDSYIRFKCRSTDDASKYLPKLKGRYLDYNLSLKLTDKISETIINEEIVSTYKPIDINKDNISTLLNDIMVNKTNDDLIIKRSHILLMDIVKDIS